MADNNALKLQDFCDIDELHQILETWSKATNMGVTVRDMDGNYIIKPIGFSEYCKMLHKTEKGMTMCINQGTGNIGSFTCYAGLYDFSLPISLPNGQCLGRIYGGQVIELEEKEPDLRAMSIALNISEDQIRAEYARITRKPHCEVAAAQDLLNYYISEFIEQNYNNWTNTHETNNDRTLSQITQILYSYNLTVNLDNGKYTLIIGTGMDRAVDIFKHHHHYTTATNEIFQAIHPAYLDKITELISLESLRSRQGEYGLLGSMEYPVYIPLKDKYEWHEVNVFADVDENGCNIVNVLGRDVTDAHERQERSARELKAAAAKNQILSEITKMLYSYNVTLNLTTGKYSLIEGTGMNKFVDIFHSTDVYDTAFNKKIQVVAPEFREQFTAIASLSSLRARKNSNGFIGNLEYRSLADGDEAWHEINVFISVNEHGDGVANILGRDITEHHKRQAQKELAAKSAAARDQLLSGITKMLYSYNITVNLKDWKYTLITGTGLDEVRVIMEQTDDYIAVYYKMRSLIMSEYRSSFDSLISFRALQATRKLRGFIGSITVAYKLENGKIVWQEINLFIGMNELGEPIANLLGRDVTEAHERQVRKDREIKAAMAKDQILSEITKTLYSYNMTVDLGTGKYSLIIGTGMKDTVNFFNCTDDYNKAFKFERSMILPEYLEEFDEKISLSALQKHKNHSGHIGQIEYAVITPEGNKEWREVNGFIGVDDAGHIQANLLGRDVTEAHDKADTKAQLEIATKANQAKTTFLFNMSHDIRTPMNAIMGFTELLAKHQTNPDRRADYLNKIRKSSTILLSLINNVLEMSRIENGAVLLDEKARNIDDSINILQDIFQEMMDKKNISFFAELNVEHHDLWVDSLKMREILLNIVSNAYKYTNSGGKVHLSIKELPSEEDGVALVETRVSDTGIGMSKEFIPHIFDEFAREHTSTESKVEGTGLGMPIVKRYVDLMNGTIKVDSVQGKGSTFIITIPYRIADKVQLESTEVVETGSVAFSKQNILLVEDNDMNAEIAMEILGEVGFSIDRAEDGDICIAKLMKVPAHTYDLILMDIQMPRMNGYEATRAIRALQDEEKANIPIIAMTANAFEEDKRDVFDSGMNGYLTKPIDIDELMKTLHTILK